MDGIPRHIVLADSVALVRPSQQPRSATTRSVRRAKYVPVAASPIALARPYIHRR